MWRLSYSRAIGLAIGIALVCGGAGYGIGHAVAQNAFSSLYSEFSPIRLTSRAHPLIAPLLAYRAPEATAVGQYGPLNAALESAVNGALASGGTTRAAIYFRDLNTNAWLGVNQNDTYYPASLLKVPVMIAYYKQAETRPELLDQIYAFNPSVLPDNSFDATSTLVIGRSYSVQELIDHMIIDSDNGATFTLLAHIDPTVLSQVYTDLGIADPGDDSGKYQISTRTYGLFFRILYNATYLSPAYSERALELLSKASFTDGLVAGVPIGTTVAHKFGEHVLSSDGKTADGVELSDCGITYYPDHPYLICVMTSATTLPNAIATIKHISAITYAEVGKRYATTTAQ